MPTVNSKQRHFFVWHALGRNDTHGTARSFACHQNRSKLNSLPTLLGLLSWAQNFCSRYSLTLPPILIQ